MSPFILATAVLDFWLAYPIGTIKNFDRKNVGIAVGILLLGLCPCALEVEICLESKVFTPQLPAKIIKTVAGTRVLQLANFHTVCSQNNVYA